MARAYRALVLREIVPNTSVKTREKILSNLLPLPPAVTEFSRLPRNREICNVRGL